MGSPFVVGAALNAISSLFQWFRAEAEKDKAEAEARRAEAQSTDGGSAAESEKALGVLPGPPLLG